MSVKPFLLDNKSTVIGAGVVSSVPLVFSSLVSAYLLQNLGYLQTLALMDWLPLFAASAFTMALALTPSTFVAIVSGFFLGWQAAPWMISAYLLASILGYSLGKLLDGGHLMSALETHPKVATAINGLKEQSWKLMILVRLSPVLPFALMNLLLPAMNVRFPVFLLAGTAGMLPRTLFSIWLGSQAQDIFSALEGSADDGLTTMVVIMLTVISAGGLLYLITQNVRKAVSEE